MWNHLVQNLGEIKVGQKTKALFTYDGNIKVTKIESSCGCTSVDWNKETQTIKVVYVGQPIPLQIQQRGEDYFATTQNVIVTSIIDGQEAKHSLMITVKIRE